MRSLRLSIPIVLSAVLSLGFGPQASQDDVILERGDKVFEQAKAAYEKARESGSVPAFIDAGFLLEEARIKYLVLQEIGQGDKQKLAADRLRGINQLSKLIHDGKVAVTGSAVDAPVAKAADAPAPAVVPATPNPEPVVAMVDVSKRAAVPDAARQKDAEKTVKDLFKEQYARKTATERQALAREMMKQALVSRDDLPTLWVLYREAQDMAVQGGDIKSALEAIESAARIFDVDALPMKSQMLTAAGKTVKSNEELGTLLEAVLGLIDDLIRVDQYDSADKTAATALLYSKKLNDPVQINRAAIRSKEVAEAKAMFLGLKRNLEILAKNPDDGGANAEMGKYLCFAKGSWDLGLRFMVKGSDAALKELAQKDIASMASSADRVVVGDGWYDLAEKEKSTLRKYQMSQRAKVLYVSALPDVSAIVKAKLDKRIDALDNIGTLPGQPGGPGSTDVTSLTPKKAVVGFGQLEINSNSKGNPVLLNGKPCKKFLFAHADSTVVYDIPPGAKQFLATGIKLDRNFANLTGSFKFIVSVDGKTLLESKQLSEIKNFELEIAVTLPPTGREITLAIDKCGDANTDWAVWAYPRFQK